MNPHIFAGLPSSVQNEVSETSDTRMMRITTIVSDITGVSFSDIMSENRREDIINARLLVYYFGVMYTRSPVVVGNFLRKTHASVISGEDTCLSLLYKNKNGFKDVFEKIDFCIKESGLDKNSNRTSSIYKYNRPGQIMHIKNMHEEGKSIESIATIMDTTELKILQIIHGERYQTKNESGQV